MISFVFFGTSDNSIIVLDELIKSGYKCSGVVTIPDKPVGRKQILTPSPIKLFAQNHNIPVYEASDKTDLINLSSKFSVLSSQFAIVADFGLLIPAQLIRAFPKGILNLHPSLLPAYQGATPAPMQILRGEKESGISIITINEKFDEGNIIAQEKYPIIDIETTETLLMKGFTIGAKLLIKILPDYLAGKLKPLPQDLSTKSYFPRLSRNDGFISWNTLKKAMKGNSITESEKPRFMQISKSSVLSSQFIVERAIRALSPWPGVWTEVNIKGQLKRLKLLKSHIEGDKMILDLVQLEGKNPVLFSQFQKAYQDGII